MYERRKRNRKYELYLVISLEWYSAFYIWIRGNFSVVTGATLPNGLICSVGTDIIFSNRHIRSLNRDISIRPKRVVLEQTHPFSQNGATFSKDISFAEQTHPFIYHFQYWIKEFFTLFLSQLAFVLGQLMTWIPGSFGNGIEHVIIPRSSPINEQHIPIITRAILAAGPA